MNPASIMKLMNAKKRFTANHPKFVSFINAMYERGIEEGTVLEVTVTRPGESPVTANIRVQPSDLELIEELKTLGNNKGMY